MKLQRLVDRFISSTSYSAYARLLGYIPPRLIQGLIPISITGVVLTQRLKGLQNVFGMLAGQGLAQLAPIPLEPWGYLLLPTILLYFAVLSAVGWSMDCAAHLLLEHAPMLNGAVFTVLDQYLSFFAMTQVLTSFRLDSSKKMQGSASAATPPPAAGGGGGKYGAQPSVRPDPILGILALVYVALPSALAPSGVSTPEQALGAAGSWTQHLMRYISDLSVRLSVLWMGSQMAWWAAGGDGLLMLYLLAVYLTAQRPSETHKNDKLTNMHTMFSLLCSQQMVGMLQGQASKGGTASFALVASSAACLLAMGLLLIQDVFPQRGDAQDEHMFSDVCAFSLSLLLTAQLERWLNGCSPIELIMTYLGVFAVLEVVRSDTWSQLIITTTTATATTTPPTAKNGQALQQHANNDGKGKTTAIQQPSSSSSSMLLLAQGVAGSNIPFFDLEAEFESLQLW